jgi:hypothetical protein
MEKGKFVIIDIRNMDFIDYLNREIDALWAKHPKDAMEAHIRAEEITRLEKLKSYEKQRSNRTRD